MSFQQLKKTDERWPWCEWGLKIPLQWIVGDKYLPILTYRLKSFLAGFFCFEQFFWLWRSIRGIARSSGVSVSWQAGGGAEEYLLEEKAAHIWKHCSWGIRASASSPQIHCLCSRPPYSASTDIFQSLFMWLAWLCNSSSFKITKNGELANQQSLCCCNKRVKSV